MQDDTTPPPIPLPDTRRRRRNRHAGRSALADKDTLRTPLFEREVTRAKPAERAQDSLPFEKPSTPLTPSQISQELALIKLEIERAKLVKLRSELPAIEENYISYEQLPPLSPANKHRFETRLRNLLSSVLDEGDDKGSPDQ